MFFSFYLLVLLNNKCKPVYLPSMQDYEILAIALQRAAGKRSAKQE
jgi:hypothetical protein